MFPKEYHKEMVHPKILSFVTHSHAAPNL